MTAVTVASPQPLHVFAWIVDSGLRDSLKSLAHALLRRVDRHTWAWPRQRGAPGGVTVEDLADGAGLSRRHAARCLRTLEQLGLVRTTFRPFDVSEYRLIPDSWQALASRHGSARQQARARRREEQLARYAARLSAAPAPVESAAAAPASPAAQRPQASAASPFAPQAGLPRWALRHGQRLDTAPHTVFALVGGAAAAVLGPQAPAEAQGGLARPVLRLWDARGRPPADDLVAELALVGRWARDAVHPDALQLRGAARGAVDRSRDLRQICDPVLFQPRLDLAREHAARVQVSPPEDPAPPPGGPLLPRRGEAPWIPPGQPPLLPGLTAPAWPDGPAAHWQQALATLRNEEDQDRGAIDIFLAPLSPLGPMQGAFVLAVPSAETAHWISRHLGEAVARLAALLGAPLGLVLDDRRA